MCSARRRSSSARCSSVRSNSASCSAGVRLSQRAIAMSARSLAGSSKSFAKVSLNMCPILPRTVGLHKVLAAANVGGQPRAEPTRLVFFARGRARLVGCSALFGSPPLPRTALVVLRTPRSASLTASAEGKAAGTSGLIRTRLLPLRSRATYLPRTPPFIDAKSYSGLRSSSAGLVVLLIEFSFAPRRSSGANDADGIVSFSMRHNQETSPLRDTNRHEPHLALGMSLVRERRRQRVFENSGCFIETDAAPSDVRRSLLGIPFELHRVRIRPRAGRPSSCRTLRIRRGGRPPRFRSGRAQLARRRLHPEVRPGSD